MPRGDELNEELRFSDRDDDVRSENVLATGAWRSEVATGLSANRRERVILPTLGPFLHPAGEGQCLLRLHDFEVVEVN